jgi:hypothetical protein
VATLCMMAWKATWTLSLHNLIQYSNNESVIFAGSELNIQLSD